MYFVGIFAVLFGLAFLLRTLGVVHFPGSFWSLFWPLVFIALGVGIIAVTHEGRKLLRRIREWLDWTKKVD